MVDDQMLTQPIRLSIDPAALEILPGLQAWAFLATGLEPQELAGPSASDLPPDLDKAQVVGHESIAVWRNAFRSMGLRASDRRSSVEQLVRRLVAGHDLKVGIWSVDLYNTLSIRHLAPIGGYDLDALTQQPILLRPGCIDDLFEPLGGEITKMEIGTRTICYAQGSTVLCWALNHRDSRRTVLKQASRSALFVSEAIDKLGAERSTAALMDLSNQLTAFGVDCSPVEAFEQG